MIYKFSNYQNNKRFLPKQHKDKKSFGKSFGILEGITLI